MAERWVYIGHSATRPGDGSIQTVVYRYPKRRKPLEYPLHVIFYRYFWNAKWRRFGGVYNQATLETQIAQITLAGEVLKKEEVDDFLHQRDPLRDLYCGEDEGC